jgi:hypothetical protein
MYVVLAISMREPSTPANVIHPDNHHLAQIQVNQNNAAHCRCAVVGRHTDLDSLPMELVTARGTRIVYLGIISSVLKTYTSNKPLHAFAQAAPSGNVSAS